MAIRRFELFQWLPIRILGRGATIFVLHGQQTSGRDSSLLVGGCGRPIPAEIRRNLLPDKVFYYIKVFVLMHFDPCSKALLHKDP